MNRKRLAASILGQPEQKKLIDDLLQKGVEWIHYDVMDGLFVDNISLIGQEVASLVGATKKHLVDVHLMVEQPGEMIENYLPVADYISFHIEAANDRQIAKIINDYGSDVSLGLAINPYTSVKRVLPFLSKIDFVLLMSVHPGQGNQKFIEDTLDKAKQLKKEITRQNLTTFIQIDGGINNQSAKKAFDSGVDCLVSGSYLVKNLNKKEVIELIKKTSG